MNWCGGPSKRIHLALDRDAPNSQDSAFSSHNMSSQIQDSQCSDFSQVATQDIFSQNNSGPQTDFKCDTQQGNKKMSMYEKWLSKRSLLKHDPAPPSSFENRMKVQGTPLNTSNSIVQNHNFSANNRSSMTANNMTARPVIDMSYLKGPERDLLRQVTYAIHDCSSEMKSVLFAVKEKLENVTEMTNEQLAETISSFLNDIWKHQEKLQQLLQEQDRGKATVSELEVKIAKKESQIALLEEQLLRAKGDEAQRFAKAVRCEMQSPQMLLKQKLEEIFECTKDTKEQQDQHLKEYKQSMETQCKQYFNLSKTGQSNSKETEKRILVELKKIPDRLVFKERELQSQLSEDIKNCLQMYRGDFENMVMDLIKKAFNQCIFSSKDFIKIFKEGKVQDIFKTQFDTISGKLCETIKSSMIMSSQQFSALQDTLAESVQQIKDHTHHQCMGAGILSQIEDRLMNIQSTMKQQFNDIQRQHSDEVKELEDKFCRHLFPGNINKQQKITDAFSFTVQPNCMKETSLNHGASYQSTQVRNTSLVTTANVQFDKTTPQIHEKDNRNGCLNSGFEYPHLMRTDHKQFLPNINMKTAIPASTSKVAAVRNGNLFAQTDKMSEKNQDFCSVGYRPFGKSAAKHGTLPVPLIASNSTEGKEKMRLQHETVQPCKKQQHTRDFQSSSSRPNRTKISTKKTNRNDKIVEDVTIEYCETSQNSSHTGRWTRSQSRYVNEVQSKLQKAFQHPEDSSKFVLDQRGSWSYSEGAATKHYPCTGQVTSVYNLNDSDVCNMPVMLKKRRLKSRGLDDSASLASFISSGYVQRKKDMKSPAESPSSSPSISVTKMTIRRKIRTPFRRPFHRDTPAATGSVMKVQSPAPTLLSEISSKV